MRTLKVQHPPHWPSKPESDVLHKQLLPQPFAALHNFTAGPVTMASQKGCATCVSVHSVFAFSQSVAFCFPPQFRCSTNGWFFHSEYVLWDTSRHVCAEEYDNRRELIDSIVGFREEYRNCKAPLLKAFSKESSWSPHQILLSGTKARDCRRKKCGGLCHNFAVVSSASETLKGFQSRWNVGWTTLLLRCFAALPAGHLSSSSSGDRPVAAQVSWFQKNVNQARCLCIRVICPVWAAGRRLPVRLPDFGQRKQAHVFDLQPATLHGAQRLRLETRADSFKLISIWMRNIKLGVHNLGALWGHSAL